MSEKSQLTALVIGGLVLGIIGLLAVTFILPLFDGDLVVNSYEATLAEDGSLQEHFTYDVGSSGQYRMLYRIWEAPLVFDGSPTQPSVRFVSMIPPLLLFLWPFLDRSRERHPKARRVAVAVGVAAIMSAPAFGFLGFIAERTITVRGAQYHIDLYGVPHHVAPGEGHERGEK